MRPFVFVVLCAGCAEGAPFAVPDPVEVSAAGLYEGTLYFDARAKLGPVRMARDTCDVDVQVVYDPTVTPAIQGSAGCTLDEFGPVEVWFGGDVVSMPFVAGDIVADPVASTWKGWFVDEDTLHGETAGKEDWEGGMVIVYEAILDVDLVQPAI